MKLCQQKTNSCSACCGVYNLDLKNDELIRWLNDSTDNFKNINLDDTYAVFKYRQNIEPTLRSKAILNDVYICPFIGWINKERTKTGCLLHPEAKVHKSITRLDKPQSHSFYGESICQNYDCLSNTNNLWPNANVSGRVLSYGRLAANHNLLRLIRILSQKNRLNKDRFIDTVLNFMEEYPIPVTSFEMALSFVFYSDDELWEVLGTLLDRDSYGKQSFQITDQGKRTGLALRDKLLLV